MRIRTISHTWRAGGLKGCLALGKYYLVKASARVAGPGRECPVCRWSGPEFSPFLVLPYGVVRAKAQCPACGALERHRAYHLFYGSFLSLPQNRHLKRILHFAPEKSLENPLRSIASSYVKSSYENPAHDEVTLDLRDLALQDESFDLLVMNYVLSCMPEDRKAIRSMWRVLSGSGVVLAGDGVAPGRTTVECDKVGYGGLHRSYGMLDLEERFAPFAVSVADITSRYDGYTRAKYGLNSPEYVIVLRKGDNSCKKAPSKREEGV